MSVCAGCGKEARLYGWLMGARCRFRLGLPLTPADAVQPPPIRYCDACGTTLDADTDYRASLCDECRVTRRRALQKKSEHNRKRVRTR